VRPGCIATLYNTVRKRAAKWASLLNDPRLKRDGGGSGQPAANGADGRRQTHAAEKKDTPCRFFPKGTCTQGKGCPFSHRQQHNQGGGGAGGGKKGKEKGKDKGKGKGGGGGKDQNGNPKKGAPGGGKGKGPGKTGGGGGCAICHAADHWKNECPHKPVVPPGLNIHAVGVVPPTSPTLQAAPGPVQGIPITLDSLKAMSAKYMAQQAAHVRCATDSYNEAKRVISGCHMVRVTHPTATAAADLDPRTVTVLNEVDTMMAEFHARLSTEAWDREVQRRDSNCLRNPGSCCTPGCPNPPVCPCYGPPTIPGIHFRDGVELCFHKSCDECVERDAVRDADGIVERSESGAVHELWFCWCHQKSRHGDDCCVTRPACCSRGAHYGDVGGEHNVDGMCEGAVTICTHSVVGSAGTTCLCHFCEKHRTIDSPGWSAAATGMLRRNCGAGSLTACTGT